MATKISESWYLKPLTIDTAFQRVIDDLVASPEDAKGKGIDLTLKSSGEVVDTTGCAVLLGWHNLNSGKRNSRLFEAVSPSAGRWKVTYPTEMLTPGTVEARVIVKLASSGSVITSSRAFRIIVERNVSNDMTGGSSDDLSAFQQGVKDLAETNAAAKEAEQNRITSEKERASSESQRVRNEESRILAEKTRETTLEELATASSKATTQAQSAAEAASTTSEKAAESSTSAETAAEAASESAAMAVEAAGRANESSALANNAANKANQVIAQLPLPSGNIPRGSAEGALCHVEDAFPSPLLSATVRGACSQIVTTGKNICPAKAFSSAGVTATVNGDGSMTLDGTATGSGYLVMAGGFYYKKVPIAESLIQPGKSYACSGALAGKCEVQLVVYDEAGSASTISNAGTVLEYHKYYGMFICFFAGAVFAKERIYPQIEQADAPTPWEPYTDGLPSPRPSWTQPIAGVSSASLAVAGRNLLPYPYKTTSGTLNGLAIGVSADGSVAVSGTATAESIIYFATGLRIPSGSYWLSGCPRGGNVTKGYFMRALRHRTGAALVGYDDTGGGSSVASVDGHDIDVYLCVRAGASVNGVVRPQLVAASSAREFTAGHFARIPADLHGNELCSLPDGTRDELEIDALGNVTLVKRTAALKLVGTEKWIIEKSVEVASGWSWFYIVFPVGEFGVNGAIGLCDAFSFVKPSELVGFLATGRQCCANTGTIGNTLSVLAQHATVAEFAAWLAEHPVTAHYKLAEPKRVPLGTIAVPALPEAVANVWPETNIPTTARIEYQRDINIALEQLAAAVVASV